MTEEYRFNQVLIMIVMVFPSELWIQKYFFSWQPASEHYEKANEESLDLQQSALQILREYMIPNRAIHCFFQKEERDWENLVHIFIRDFHAYLLHTAVPVSFIFLIHALGFLSLLGCQNYWKAWKLITEVSNENRNLWMLSILQCMENWARIQPGCSRQTDRGQ